MEGFPSFVEMMKELSPILGAYRDGHVTGADQQQIRQQPFRAASAVAEPMDRGKAEMGIERRFRRCRGLFQPLAKRRHQFGCSRRIISG